MLSVTSYYLLKCILHTLHYDKWHFLYKQMHTYNKNAWWLWRQEHFWKMNPQIFSALWIIVPAFLLGFLANQMPQLTFLFTDWLDIQNPYSSALSHPPHTSEKHRRLFLLLLFVFFWNPQFELSPFNLEYLKCCCICAWLWVGWTACGREDCRVHNASVCDVTILPYMFSRTN